MAKISQLIIEVLSENVLTNKLDTGSSLYISESLHQKELKCSCIKKGNVLLNIVGASIGRSCVYMFDYDANCNQAVSILRLKEETVISYFLSYWFNSSNAQSQMFKEKYGGARDNLNLGQVGEFEIPLPPLSTQRQIVEKLDRQIQALDGVQFLKTEAEKRIEKILERVWGEEGVCK
ncbi:MAG: restriction endonuclease subunit S [Nitrospirota bacterium]